MKLRISGTDIMIHLVLAAAIMSTAAQLYPESVQIKNFATLVVATILIWIVTGIVHLLCLIAGASGVAMESIFLWIMISVIDLSAQVIAISIMSAILNDFTVVGLLPKALISIAYAFFCSKVAYEQ